MADARRLLAENAALEAQAKEHGQLLRQSMDRELDRINREIDAFPKGRTLLEPALATRYTQLVTDRAKILQAY